MDKVCIVAGCNDGVIAYGEEPIMTRTYCQSCKYVTELDFNHHWEIHIRVCLMSTMFIRNDTINSHFPEREGGCFAFH